MRRTRTRLATVAAAISATGLILTGCGSGDDGSDDQIQGADQADTSTEPTDDASNDEGEDAANRPEVELPDSFSNVYDDWESDSATEQAVLDDGRRRTDARDLAVIEQDPNADYFTFYNEGLALENTQDWIQGFIDNGVTIEGTIRYYDPKVILHDDGTATLNYCADESEARSYYIETGEDEDADGSQVLYNTELEENSDGVWVTTSVWSDEREECTT